MSNRLSLSLTPAELAHYQNAPAMLPPPGVVSNFDMANTRADLYVILCSILLFIASTFVLLRLYAKVWINHSPGLDDGMHLRYEV